MKTLLKYFINGLLTILPIVLAVYIIYKIFGIFMAMENGRC
ncbi:hypothetical protein [Fictibacillus barbaricus]|nr:hypothetical protein [Fictibacillus barbaricus]